MIKKRADLRVDVGQVVDAAIEASDVVCVNETSERLVDTSAGAEVEQVTRGEHEAVSAAVSADASEDVVGEGHGQRLACKVAGGVF